MSLWVMAGVQAIRNTTQVLDSSTKVYIDDRTVTASSAPVLFRLYTAWQSWSQSVGLVESVSKTRVAAARSSNAVVAGRFFDPGVVQPAVRVLGAVSACVRRALHADELRRLADAKRVIRLLGCCSFLLGNHLRCVRQFAIAKACYGWVVRAPTWSVSQNLFTATFVAARRVRYTRLRGCGLCFLVVICTLMWFGSRVWLLLSCGSVFAPVFCLLGRVGSGRVLLAFVVGCLRRVSRSFSRGFGGMSSRTFVSISRVVVCRVAMLTVTLVWLNTMSDKGGGRGSFSAGWGLVGMSCFVSLRCPLTRSVLWTLPMSALGSCLLLRLLRLGLGLPSVLVTGLSCPMLVISLLPAFGGAGKLGSGITSAGPAPVVLPLFRVVLAVLCWLALVGLGKTPIFLRKKLTKSDLGFRPVNWGFGILRYPQLRIPTLLISGPRRRCCILRGLQHYIKVVIKQGIDLKLFAVFNGIFPFQKRSKKVLIWSFLQLSVAFFAFRGGHVLSLKMPFKQILIQRFLRLL